MLSIFQNSFNIGLINKLASRSWLNTTPHLKHADTLLREISGTFLTNTGQLLGFHATLYIMLNQFRFHTSSFPDGWPRIAVDEMAISVDKTGQVCWQIIWRAGDRQRLQRSCYTYLHLMFDLTADASRMLRHDWLYLFKVSNERRLKHSTNQTAHNLVDVSDKWLQWVGSISHLSQLVVELSWARFNVLPNTL